MFNWFKKLQLSHLLLTMITIWTILFYLAHGASIFIYLGMHLCTTGIFCFLVFRRLAQGEKKAKQ